MNIREAAACLEEIARLLELKGENPFKARAYTGAARTLRASKLDLAGLTAKAKAGEVRGIGKAISAKLDTIVQSGDLPYLNELRAEFPPGVRELLSIPGLGAAKVRTLTRDLGVQSPGELEYACIENRLIGLKGFGPKLQARVLDGIRARRRYRSRSRLPEALDVAQNVRNLLSQSGTGAVQVEWVGDLRRFCETVDSVTFLVAGITPAEAAACLETCRDVDGIQGAPERVECKFAGVPVTLRLVDPAAFHAAEVVYTGSQGHVEALRRRAAAKGVRLEASGVTRGEGPVGTDSEDAVYRALGLPPIPPELREDRGEIEAAEGGDRFDDLVCEKDVLGILHLHTTWSDGAFSVREMAEAAQRAGMEYIGVTDHSRSAFYANGLQPEAVLRQHEEIDALNRDMAPFRIFKGIESDILPDGRLDYEDEILERFEFVIASVHSSFRQPEEKMTERILRAVRNPFTSILGHPTGRLLLAREPYAVDMARVLEVAAEAGTAVELNANPHRLDLDWRLLARARELGVPVPICPDAHSTDGLADVFFGIGIARKGRLTPTDVPNCLTAGEIGEFFRRKHR